MQTNNPSSEQREVGVRTRNGNLSAVRSSLLVDWRANELRGPLDLHHKAVGRASESKSGCVDWLTEVDL
jgi:hypothetical protein